MRKIEETTTLKGKKYEIKLVERIKISG